LSGCAGGIFGMKRKEIIGGWSSVICSLQEILLVSQDSDNDMGGTWREQKFVEMFGEKNRKSREHLEHLGLDWMIILKCVSKKYDGNLLAGLIWLRIQTRGKLVRIL